MVSRGLFGPPWESERDMKGQECDAVTTSGTDILWGEAGIKWVKKAEASEVRLRS